MSDDDVASNICQASPQHQRARHRAPRPEVRPRQLVCGELPHLCEGSAIITDVVHCVLCEKPPKLKDVTKYFSIEFLRFIPKEQVQLPHLQHVRIRPAVRARQGLVGLRERHHGLQVDEPRAGPGVDVAARSEVVERAPLLGGARRPVVAVRALPLVRAWQIMLATSCDAN